MLIQLLKKAAHLGIIPILLVSIVGIAFAQETTVPTPDKVKDPAWTLVPPECLGPDAAGYHDDEKTDPVCGFPQMLQLIANIMGLLIVIALSLGALLFAYAGFRYATALGNPSQIQGAKKIFTSVAIGLVIVFLAFTIVQVVVGILGVETQFNKFMISNPRP